MKLLKTLLLITVFIITPFWAGIAYYATITAAEQVALDGTLVNPLAVQITAALMILVPPVFSWVGITWVCNRLGGKS